MLPGGIRRNLLLLVLAAVVPFIALIGVGLWSQWEETEAGAKQRALEQARVLAAQVDDHIGNLEHLLIGLSRAVSTDPADVSANDILLRKVKAELPDFVSGISIFSLNGNNIGSTWGGGGANPNDRLYFREVLAGRRLAIGEVHMGRVSREWVVNIAGRVEDRDGRLRAVLVAGTRLAHFQDALRVQGLPTGAVVRIVNEHGIVIAQSVNGPNWIGRDLGHSEPIARHLAAGEATEMVTWSDGAARLTASSTAHRAPWLVSVGLPKDMLYVAVFSQLRWSALLSTIALASVFGIAWMLSGRIVRPLQQLEKDAAVLAAGELGHRTEVDSGDEAGKLALAFNRMAASLERRQEEVQQAKDTLAAVIDASPVAISCCDLDRRIILWNRAAEQIYGYSAEEAIGHTVRVIPPEGLAESLTFFKRAIAGEVIRDAQVKRLRKDGTVIDVKLSAAPMHNRDGSVRAVAWAVEDITDRRKAEEQLKRLAHYDPLTGLPNRLSLQKELGRLLSGNGAARCAGIALFDLDEFKDVNDTLGHSVGDQLLMEIGHRLVEVCDCRGKTAKVFRLGGDEFVVVIPDCGDPCRIDETVKAMLAQLAVPFEIGDHILHLGGSAGIAIAPNDGVTVDELIANADLALYQAKADGGNICRYFQPVLRAHAQARRALDGELRRAFAQNEFELYFQPQVRIKDGTIVGAEALLRWRHPERGLLAPGAFIEALAASSIAPQLGSWIIRTACHSAASWRSAGLGLGRIAVNLFPAQLYDEAFLNDIRGSLRATGLSADALELEITENVALDQRNGTEPLHTLYQEGVKLAFDDFGTGYASLSYLTRLPLSRIKIDRSFVRKISENAQDAAIVRSLITMAHNLGLAVVAEGVETEAQATFLRHEGCEEAQGFLYAAPLPATEFERYLRTKSIAPQGAAQGQGYAPHNPVRLRASG
jgi:diguanylate cyclase (GGDEF)-like protein/PAS domain S-box-containing protein